MSDERRSDAGRDAAFADLREALGEVREALDRADRTARRAETASTERVEHDRRNGRPQWTWRAKLWACPAETRLGVQEVVEALGVSRSWIYSRTKADAEDPIPHRKLGGVLIFVAGELRHWLRTHEEAPVEGPSWSPVKTRLGLVDPEAA